MRFIPVRTLGYPGGLALSVLTSEWVPGTSGSDERDYLMP